MRDFSAALLSCASASSPPTSASAQPRSGFPNAEPAPRFSVARTARATAPSEFAELADPTRVWLGQ
jgi:hypothetical protein